MCPSIYGQILDNSIGSSERRAGVTVSPPQQYRQVTVAAQQPARLPAQHGGSPLKYHTPLAPTIPVAPAQMSSAESRGRSDRTAGVSRGKDRCASRSRSPSPDPTTNERELLKLVMQLQKEKAKIQTESEEKYMRLLEREDKVRRSETKLEKNRETLVAMFEFLEPFAWGKHWRNLATAAEAMRQTVKDEGNQYRGGCTIWRGMEALSEVLGIGTQLEDAFDRQQRLAAVDDFLKKYDKEDEERRVDEA